MRTRECQAKGGTGGAEMGTQGIHRADSFTACVQPWWWTEESRERQESLVMPKSQQLPEEASPVLVLMPSCNSMHTASLPARQVPWSAPVYDSEN